MRIEIPLPELAEGVYEADVVQILVSPGDKIEEGQNLVEVETDKASVPVPSTRSGILFEILVKEGERIAVGKIMMILETDASAAVAKEQTSSSAAPKGPHKQSARPTMTASENRAQSPIATPSTESPSKEGKPVSSGPGVSVRPISDKTSLPDFSRWGAIRRVPLTSLRRKIGENVLQSWVTIPHVHQFHEADITDLEEMRKRHVDDFSKRNAPFTMTVLLLKALVHTLKAYPSFNASLDVDAGEIVLKDYYHIGVAVDTEAGLIVPVLRDVDSKGPVALAQELTDLARRTRERQVSPDELQGGTFSLSNLGGIGGTHFTPIIRAPETAVLGVGRAQDRVVLRDGRVESRRYLPLCLAYDHRVIDGADGARFITHLVHLLENYEGLLLGL